MDASGLEATIERSKHRLVLQQAGVIYGVHSDNEKMLRAHGLIEEADQHVAMMEQIRASVAVLLADG
jgi:hypothetical protein